MYRFYKKSMIFLLLPSMILFTLIVLIPFIIGVLYSFTSWRGSYFFGGDYWWQAWIGIENYVKVFTSEGFLQALIYTTKFAVILVIIENIFSLIMAMGVQNMIKGKGVFRTIFFFPYLLGGLAMGYVWKFIFENVYSYTLFGENGIIPIPWLCNMLQNNTTSLLAFAIMATWQSAGYYLLIYLNGLNNISVELYEAASIDGAKWFQKFKNITLPLLMPSFTVVLFLTLSSGFKMLDVNIALTGGDFNTTMLSYEILKTVRESSPPNYGIAQAEAVIFFVIVAVISITQVVIMKRKEIEA